MYEIDDDILMMIYWRDQTWHTTVPACSTHRNPLYRATYVGLSGATDSLRPRREAKEDKGGEGDSTDKSGKSKIGERWSGRRDSG